MSKTYLSGSSTLIRLNPANKELRFIMTLQLALPPAAAAGRPHGRLKTRIKTEISAAQVLVAITSSCPLGEGKAFRLLQSFSFRKPLDLRLYFLVLRLLSVEL